MLKALRRFLSNPSWFVDCNPVWGVVEVWGMGFAAIAI